MAAPLPCINYLYAKEEIIIKEQVRPSASIYKQYTVLQPTSTHIIPFYY